MSQISEIFLREIPSFFDTEELRAALAEEARRWIGTPFVARAGVCKAGVDCVHLCAEIYRKLGFLEKFEPPRYALDAGFHMDRSMTINWIESSKRFSLILRVEGGARISTKAVQIGDALCFRNGRVAHHAGLQITDRTFIQAHRRYGVIESELADPAMLERLCAVYRPRPL